MLLCALDLDNEIIDMEIDREYVCDRCFYVNKWRVVKNLWHTSLCIELSKCEESRMVMKYPLNDKFDIVFITISLILTL